MYFRLISSLINTTWRNCNECGVGGGNVNYIFAFSFYFWKNQWMWYFRVNGKCGKTLLSIIEISFTRTICRFLYLCKHTYKYIFFNHRHNANEPWKLWACFYYQHQTTKVNMRKSFTCVLSVQKNQGHIFSYFVISFSISIIL